MGLDMYLNAKRYISEYSDKEDFDKLSSINLTNMPIKGITCEAMYWRKANSIHNWFVQNVQDGVDDCGIYEVERSKLTELLFICQKVLENRELALELMPPCKGFFFGSTDLNEWYWEDLVNTVDGITKVLESTGGERSYMWDFTYQSSW